MSKAWYGLLKVRPLILSHAIRTVLNYVHLVPLTQTYILASKSKVIFKERCYE